MGLLRLTLLAVVVVAANDVVIGMAADRTAKNPCGKGSLCGNVTFVTRAEWNARSPKSRVAMPVPVGYSIVHHTATKPCATLQDCCANMRAFQNWHMDDRGWDDIGYNLVIGGDERVYMGRGWNTVGAHAGSQYYNYHSVGIAVIGNYTDVLPSPGVLKVLNQVIECGVKSGYLTEQYVLRGHRDVRELGPTDCPGDKLYAEIRTWPHYLEPLD